jgi:hypothetical protein
VRSEVAVEEIVVTLYIQTIRAKLELCRIVCASLCSTLEDPNLTLAESSMISARWAQRLRDGDILAFFLDLLRRDEREQRVRHIAGDDPK